MMQWSGISPLHSATPYWNPTETPLGYLVVALCHDDPVVLDLGGQFHSSVQQFINRIEVRVGPVQSSGSEPEKSHSQYGSPETLATRASSVLLPRRGTGTDLPSVAASEEHGLFPILMIL